jgi:phage repressor protein C with HTH and peptisase S24 domain
MVPTLHDGDVVLVRRTTRAKVGDLVLVRWVSRPGQLSVKRVRAPGYFVVGDNPYASTDSRELGPAEVVAVVVATFRQRRREA